jgi:hypothetical protein
MAAADSRSTPIAEEGDMSHRYQKGGVEPPLDELLVDPIVHLVLRRDHINVGDLTRYIAEARDRLLDEHHQTISSNAATPHARFHRS